jgi:hypothetical protein
MYDCFHQKEKAEFMLITALSFAAELNVTLGLNLKTIGGHMKNVFEELEGK